MSCWFLLSHALGLVAFGLADGIFRTAADWHCEMASGRGAQGHVVDRRVHRTHDASQSCLGQRQGDLRLALPDRIAEHVRLGHTWLQSNDELWGQRKVLLDDTCSFNARHKFFTTVAHMPPASSSLRIPPNCSEHLRSCLKKLTGFRAGSAPYPKSRCTFA